MVCVTDLTERPTDSSIVQHDTTVKQLAPACKHWFTGLAKRKPQRLMNIVHLLHIQA